MIVQSERPSVNSEPPVERAGASRGGTAEPRRPLPSITPYATAIHRYRTPTPPDQPLLPERAARGMQQRARAARAAPRIHVLGERGWIGLWMNDTGHRPTPSRRVDARVARTKDWGVHRHRVGRNLVATIVPGPVNPNRASLVSELPNP